MGRDLDFLPTAPGRHGRVLRKEVLQFSFVFSLLHTLSRLDVLIRFLPQDSLSPLLQARARVRDSSPPLPCGTFVLSSGHSAGLKGAFYKGEGALVLDASIPRKEQLAGAAYKTDLNSCLFLGKAPGLHDSRALPPREGTPAGSPQRWPRFLPGPEQLTALPPHFPISFLRYQPMCFSQFPLLGQAGREAGRAEEGSFQITFVS